MGKKPDSTPKGDPEKKPENSDASDANKMAGLPDIQIAWAQIISAAAQDPAYAQKAFADLDAAFKELGIEDVSDIDMDKDLVPSLPDAQRMVTGALNLKAQEQAAQGWTPYGYSYGTYATGADAQYAQDPNAAEEAENEASADQGQSNSDQSNFQGGTTMYTDQSATYMGGCVGTFGTAGSLGTVGGTAGSAATVGSYGSAGMPDPDGPSATEVPKPTLPSVPTQPTILTRPTILTQPTIATSKPTVASLVSKPTQPTIATQATQATKLSIPTQPTQPTQPCIPTQPCVPTQPTQPCVPTQPTQPCIPSLPSQPPCILTKPCIPTQPCLTTPPTEATLKPTIASLQSQASLVSQPAPISSTRLSGGTYADPMMGGCWGSAGTIGSAGSFGGTAGTIGTGACYGCAGGDDAKLTPVDPCTGSVLSQQTIASIKPTLPTVASRLTQASIKPTIATQPTTASLKTIGSLVSQPAPLSAEPMAGGCNGTFGTVGCLGSVGGTAGSAGTVGTYGSAGIVAELQAERATMIPFGPCQQPTTMTTATAQGTFKANMADLSSTRLSGATMGSFATYCGCVADSGEMQDPMMGGCWGSAGTIGSAGSFGGTAGTVGSAACYGCAGDSLTMELSPSAMSRATVSTLRTAMELQPMGGAASYGCGATVATYPYG